MYQSKLTNYFESMGFTFEDNSEGLNAKSFVDNYHFTISRQGESYTTFGSDLDMPAPLPFGLAMQGMLRRAELIAQGLTFLEFAEKWPNDGCGVVYSHMEEQWEGLKSLGVCLVELELMLAVTKSFTEEKTQ